MILLSVPDLGTRTLYHRVPDLSTGNFYFLSFCLQNGNLVIQFSQEECTMEERKFNEEFGLRVKSRREELGLTQGELARKIGYQNRSTISMIESGERTVKPEFLNALAAALETTPSYLMGWERRDLLEDLEEAINGLPESDIRFLLQTARLLKEKQQP